MKFKKKVRELCHDVGATALTAADTLSEALAAMERETLERAASLAADWARVRQPGQGGVALRNFANELRQQAGMVPNRPELRPECTVCHGHWNFITTDCPECGGSRVPNGKRLGGPDGRHT